MPCHSHSEAASCIISIREYSTYLELLDGLESEHSEGDGPTILYKVSAFDYYFGFLEKAVCRKPAPSTKREPETGTSNRTLLVGVGNGVSLDTFVLLSCPEKANNSAAACDVEL